MTKPPGNDGPGPGEILGMSGAFWKSCVLHTAIRIGVFELLADSPLDIDEMTRRLDAGPRGVAPFLNALAAMGLLRKEGESTFSLSPAAESFLLRRSPRYLGYMIRHHGHLLPSWGRLDEAVLTGRPVGGRSSEKDGDALESFIMGMHNNSMGYARRAVEAVDLTGCSRLLDLGGGPGTWAVHFALQNADLEATVFDLPGTRPFAERTIADFQLSHRVSFVSGDFLADELPGPYDAAWLSHILHGEGPEDCRLIIRKAVGSLNKGGLILIHEFILDDDMASPLFPALFSLNMLTGTPQGRSYSRAEIAGMLLDAGCRDPQLLPFVGPTESRILSARL